MTRYNELTTYWKYQLTKQQRLAVALHHLQEHALTQIRAAMSGDADAIAALSTRLDGFITGELTPTTTKEEIGRVMNRPLKLLITPSLYVAFMGMQPPAVQACKTAARTLAEKHFPGWAQQMKDAGK